MDFDNHLFRSGCAFLPVREAHLFVGMRKKARYFVFFVEITKKMIVFARKVVTLCRITIKNSFRMMKKTLIAAVALCMATLNGNAQSAGYGETRHEVAVSYGCLSNSQIFDDFGEIGGALVHTKYENKKSFGPISVEYFYHLKPWLGVGGIAAYGNFKEDAYLFGDKIGESKNHYITVMPAAKFDWLRRKNFGLYSKLAVGATLRNEKFEADTHTDDDNEVHFNWQVSAIGIEAGSPTVRGFAEVGMGEQGMLLAGLRYKF